MDFYVKTLKHELRFYLTEFPREAKVVVLVDFPNLIERGNSRSGSDECPHSEAKTSGELEQKR